MPANLPPNYFEAEKRYREATTVSEKISHLEEMLRIMPKHKGTDHLKADLRRKLSKLRISPGAKKGVSRRAAAFQISKEGAGQVAIIGPTNVGKSSLVEALTNATPEVSEVPFSTWKPTPGMMPIEDIQVQLIDTPPLDREFIEPALMDLIRRTDMILAVVDLETDPVLQLETSLSLLEENRILPDHLQDGQTSMQRMTYKPFLVLANKCDDQSCDENYEIFRALLAQDWPMIFVSAKTKRNFEHLKKTIFERLKIVRVYTKAPSEGPDLSRPFVLHKGDTVEDLAGKIHQDFLYNLKFAKVWGKGVFEGQMVQRDHILHDGDVVELQA